MTDLEAIVALMGSLYRQLLRAQEENMELRSALVEQAKDHGTPFACPTRANAT